jgi:chromosomal replication initiation ATPase DnaA
MRLKYSPEQIINTVCQTLELDVEKFRSKLRNTKYSDGRFIAAYLIKAVYARKTKYKDLTPLFNRKVMVIYDEKVKCHNLLSVNNEFREKYMAVYNKLSQIQNAA